MSHSFKKALVYALLILNVGVILWFWWPMSGTLLGKGTSSTVLALGRLFGLLAAFSVLVQFIMMGRTHWIEDIFGLDKISRIHRLNGYSTITFILLHPVFIIYSYALDGKVSVVKQFLIFLSEFDLLKGFIAVCLFSVVVLSSIYIVRRRLRYEWWYAIHLLTYLGVYFAWGHQLADGGDFGSKPFVWYWYGLYIFVFTNVLLFRFARPVFLYGRHRFRVAGVTSETDAASSIYITGDNIHKFKIKPGQFMILRFLSKNRWYEAHPFSLSWIPEKNTLRVTAKHAGDFTRKVHSIKKDEPVLIDGPYGVFTAEQAHTHKYLFIAGGIGITPLRSLIEHTAKKGNDIAVIYSNKTSKDVVFKKELDELVKTYNFPVHYIMTQEKTYKESGGRLNAEMIKKFVPDVTSRDVYVCGPAGMIHGIQKVLHILGVPKKHIHFEKFSMT